MIKRPNIINISLTAPKDHPKTQDAPSKDFPLQFCTKNSEAREQMTMQGLMSFIKMVGDERSGALRRQRKAAREAGKTCVVPEREQMLLIPRDVCECVDLLLRKYLLYKLEEKQEGLRSRHKLPHDRANSLRTLLRINKENEPLQEEEVDETAPFRNMAAHRQDREKLQSRCQELEAEVADLRERLKEKNTLISKMIGRETQLRRKYNDEINRLARSRNIYNISANFQREEEEGQGRNALNVAGKHLQSQKQQEIGKMSAYFKSLQKPITNTLIKSDSEYIKDGRPRLNKSKKKLHPFRPSQKHPPPNLFKTINKSLPTEVITRREIEATNRKELTREQHTLQIESRPTFELYVQQLESASMSKKHSLQGEVKKGSMISKMRDEQFQALQQHGFYNDQNLKQIDSELKI